MGFLIRFLLNILSVGFNLTIVRLGAKDPVRVSKESPARSIVSLSGQKSIAVGIVDGM